MEESKVNYLFILNNDRINCFHNSEKKERKCIIEMLQNVYLSELLRLLYV